LAKAKIDVVYDPNYRTIVVNGLVGRPIPGFLEAMIYTDESVVDEVLKGNLLEGNTPIKRVVQCRLVIPISAAKTIAKWFNDWIKEYDTKIGEFRSSEEMTGQAKTTTRTV